MMDTTTILAYLANSLSALFLITTIVLMSIRVHKTKDYHLISAMITRFILLVYMAFDYSHGVTTGTALSLIGGPVRCWVLASVFLSDAMIQGLRLVSRKYFTVVPSASLEKTLENVRYNYKTLIDTAPVGIYIIALDGTMEYINKRLQEITGYTPKDVIGRNIMEFLVPEDAEKTKEVLRQRASREVLRDSYPRTIIKKDGTLLQLRVFSNLTENGHPTITGSVIPLDNSHEGS